MKIQTSKGDTCSYCHLIGIDSFGNIYRVNGFKLNVVNTSNYQSGINLIIKDDDFKIFPNPTSGEIEILFNKQVNDASIRVINIAGQTIMEIKQFSGNFCNINLSQQSAGMYFVEILQKEIVFRKKLIKQ